MFELLGLVFGGVSRLTQHWLELKDKDKERSHEAVMYDKQMALADKRHEHDADLRKMDAASAEAAAEWNALAAAVQAQATEAQAAGGWVAKLSASVRPVVTYWLLGLYSLSKLFAILVALKANEPFLLAVSGVYGEADAALLFSVLSFWFMDRSLRKR
jgi:hypothetical protein